LVWGYVLLLWGASPTYEEGPSTFVDEEFNTELDELLRRED